MYLPQNIPDAKVLITVKTYPRPTPSYEEIVCTAGILETGEWIRIYPVPFRDLPYEQQFSKFNWIKLDLEKNDKDFRRESYCPKQRFDEVIHTHEFIGTQNKWLERKRWVLKNVYDSMSDLIGLAMDENLSLATLKPFEIIDFLIEAEEEREWEHRYTDRLKQMKLFEDNSNSSGSKREIIKKLPYKYYYRFATNGDNNPRKMQILDWEIGALFWNCIKSTEGDEIEANELVKKKYFDNFAQTKDTYLFLGTTYSHHKRKARNPFTIIGVFPPPVNLQLSLGI